jgi:hypothetical protein
MTPNLVISIVAVMGTYLIARLSGTDFSKVEAPPALFSPIPAWLFALYAIGGAAAMFPLFTVSLKLQRPRLLAVAVILAGLAVMTPAPFLVSKDFSTIAWLNLVHIAYVAPLLALAWSLPSRKPLNVSEV